MSELLFRQLFPVLREQRLLRDIDIELARSCARFEPDAMMLLAVALVSNELGRGHVCLALSHWPERLTQWLAQVPELAPALASLLPREVAAHPEPVLSARFADSALVYPVTSPAELPAHGRPFTLFAGRLYLSRYYAFEQFVAGWLQQAAVTDETTAAAGLSQQLVKLFAPQTETDWQAIAVATAARGRFTLISGGPGTGKTTTVTKLLALLVAQSEQPLLIRLAAPTGKAAARLTESISKARQSLAATMPAAWLAGIPTEASTLHRLLGVIPGQPEFRHRAENPLPLEVLVVDEASMIDLPMMARLLAALPPRAKLILLGDKDQLASVEAGAVLGDICQFVTQGISATQAGRLQQDTGYALQAYVQTAGHPLRDRLCLLRKSYRFDARSGIGQLAAAVNQGNAAAVQAIWSQDFSDIRLHSDEQRLAHAVALAAHGYQRYLAHLHQPMDATRAVSLLADFNDLRVLCAVHDGPWGINSMNEAIAQRLHQQGDLVREGDWYAGRPVMITENDYGLGLYNGDIGVAASDGERLRVWFQLPDGHIHGFLPSRLPAHDTAWAMTVHKSQGSEFSHTLLLLPPEMNPLLTRELLYTGITRARQRLDLFATPDVLTRMAGKATERYSGLVTMLETMQRLHDAE